MFGLKLTGAVLGFIVVCYTLGFLITGGNLAMYRFWAPKQAAAQRQVFEQTQSYVEGKIAHLALLQTQYELATDFNEKMILRTYILSEASTVEEDNLPPRTVAFLNSLRGGVR